MVSRLNNGHMLRHSLSLCLGAVLDLRCFFPAGAKYISCMISIRPHIDLLYSYWFKWLNQIPRIEGGLRLKVYSQDMGFLQVMYIVNVFSFQCMCVLRVDVCPAVSY